MYSPHGRTRTVTLQETAHHWPSELVLVCDAKGEEEGLEYTPPPPPLGLSDPSSRPHQIHALGEGLELGHLEVISDLRLVKEPSAI
jgi:hypothetical protein